MRTTVMMSLALMVALAAAGVKYETGEAQASPLPPDTGGVMLPATSSTPAEFPRAQDEAPAALSIPAAGIRAPIVPVGLDDIGAMDVPAGSSNEVGWYAPGTAPGGRGSAVLDAHVFAAFKNLHKVQVGDNIYVDTEGSTTLRFKVKDVETYALADVPAQRLFNAAGGRYLNLITCAGTYIPSQGTYSKRLVVYAELVGS